MLTGEHSIYLNWRFLVEQWVALSIICFTFTQNICQTAATSLHSKKQRDAFRFLDYINASEWLRLCQFLKWYCSISTNRDSPVPFGFPRSSNIVDTQWLSLVIENIPHLPPTDVPHITSSNYGSLLLPSR